MPLLTGVDIALMVDRLLPAANWGTAQSYALLVASWRDAQTIPTEQAILDEWNVYVAEQAATKHLRDREADPEMPSIEIQVEALMNNAAGDPALLNRVLSFIANVKARHPAP